MRVCIFKIEENPTFRICHFRQAGGDFGKEEEAAMQRNPLGISSSIRESVGKRD